MLRIEVYSSSIPKPIIEMLGNPQSIKFVVNDNNEVACSIWKYPQ